MKECVEILRHYTTARIPFVVFDTTEMRRALDIIKQVNTELSIPGTYVHTLNKGMYDITSGAVVDEDTTFYGAMAYMSEQMRRKQELTFVLCSASGLDEETAETRQLLNIVDTAVETGGMIIAITTGPIWNQLQRAGMRLTLDFPDEQEMRGIIYNMLDGYRNFQIEWDDNDIKEAAQMLAGVSQIEAENVIADLLANQKILKSDLDSLRFVKDRLFSDISGLERIKVDPRDGEVGGLSGLQAWLNDKKKLQTPAMREQMRQLGLPAPRGILLVGVPGCGKSLSAKAIAANWNLPLYRLDFATVQGSYVGQSERQLREALETAEQVSPCVLWIDEIEKGLSGATGTGDSSGVSREWSVSSCSGFRSAGNTCSSWRRPTMSRNCRRNCCAAAGSTRFSSSIYPISRNENPSFRCTTAAMSRRKYLRRCWISWPISPMASQARILSRPCATPDTTG